MTWFRIFTAVLAALIVISIVTTAVALIFTLGYRVRQLGARDRSRRHGPAARSA